MGKCGLYKDIRLSLLLYLTQIPNSTIGKRSRMFAFCFTEDSSEW